MKFKLFSLLLILNLISIDIRAQKKNNLSGEYIFGNDINVSDCGKVLISQEASDSLLIYINVSKAAPSYSTTMLLTKLGVTNNTSRYLTEDSNGCSLIFEFEDDKIKTIQNSSCGTAHLNRTFIRINNTVPKFFYLGNGEKVQLSENTSYFSKNHYQAERIFNWSIGLCEYTGLFRDSEFTVSQLEHAYALTDIHSIERQNVFSYHYNFNKNINLKEFIHQLELKALKLKQDYLTLSLIDNTVNWNLFITDNIESIDKQLSVQKTILQSFNNPKYLIKSDYYKIVKTATDVLNSKDKEIEGYFFKEFQNKSKTTSIESMKKIIYNERIEAVLYSTFKSRYEIFTDLFDLTTENCINGPY